MSLLKTKFVVTALIVVVTTISCSDDFLDRVPLDQPSMETFWSSPEQAEMWVNYLYRVASNSTLGLMGVDITTQEAYSDNAYGRTNRARNTIATGTFDPTDSHIRGVWNYRNIRLCHEFFEYVGQVPGMPESKLNELSGQVKFFLAFEYYKLTTRFRDVPLVKKVLNVNESDVPKSPKAEVVAYLLEQLDEAIALLPETYPAGQEGRITKGAALFLKARVLLYNERWAEAAETAKQVMDLGIYELHPNFEELFMEAFNNATKESILETQYAENAREHSLGRTYNYRSIDGFALIQPMKELGEAFPMADGLPIDESPLYNPSNPFENRDPRFYATFNYPGRTMNGITFDPINDPLDKSFTFTYLFYRKYVTDFVRGEKINLYKNWYVFRYAEVLLMYAEAKNEASGPESSIYDALDLLRSRAGMPPVD